MESVFDLFARQVRPLSLLAWSTFLTEMHSDPEAEEDFAEVYIPEDFDDWIREKWEVWLGETECLKNNIQLPGDLNAKASSKTEYFQTKMQSCVQSTICDFIAQGLVPLLSIRITLEDWIRKTEPREYEGVTVVEQSGASGVKVRYASYYHDKLFITSEQAACAYAREKQQLDGVQYKEPTWAQIPGDLSHDFEIWAKDRQLVSREDSDVIYSIFTRR